MIKTILIVIATLLTLSTAKTCKKCMSMDYSEMDPAMTADELAAVEMGEQVDEAFKICSEAEDETCDEETNICVNGYVYMSDKEEDGGVTYTTTGMKLNMQDCAPAEADCDYLSELLTKDEQAEGIKTWVTECSFQKCHSDGTNCEALSEETQEEPEDEPSSAAAMSSLLVTLVALFNLLEFRDLSY